MPKAETVSREERFEACKELLRCLQGFDPRQVFDFDTRAGLLGLLEGYVSKEICDICEAEIDGLVHYG